MSSSHGNSLLRVLKFSLLVALISFRTNTQVAQVKCIKTRHPLVLHICVSELGQHWVRKWLVTYSAPNHYLHQCWNIINWTLRNKFQWNFNQRINFSFKNMHLKISSVKWQPFCSGGDELRIFQVLFLSVTERYCIQVIQSPIPFMTWENCFVFSYIFVVPVNMVGNQPIGSGWAEIERLYWEFATLNCIYWCESYDSLQCLLEKRAFVRVVFS